MGLFCLDNINGHDTKSGSAWASDLKKLSENDIQNRFCDDILSDKVVLVVHTKSQKCSKLRNNAIAFTFLWGFCGYYAEDVYPIWRVKILICDIDTK